MRHKTSADAFTILTDKSARDIIFKPLDTNYRWEIILVCSKFYGVHDPIVKITGGSVDPLNPLCRRPRSVKVDQKPFDGLATHGHAGTLTALLLHSGEG